MYTFVELKLILQYAFYFSIVAAKEGTRVLGKLPLDPAYAKAADAGAFYEMENPYLDAAVDALKTI